MMGRSSRRGRTVAAVVTGLVAGSGGIFAMFAATAAPAFADSSAYELYCPGTPVGNIVLNGVITTGTITPAAPASGAQFNLTNYQSNVSLPSSIVSAAAALGNSSITGTASVKVDATGATPASVAAPPITINAPIPSPVPSTGLTLSLPSTPGTVGPFTASGGAISLTVDPSVSLGLVVSGSTLNLTCNPYPNNTAPTGISSTAPAGAKAAPVIASTSGSSAAPPPAATPTTAAAATPTTAAAATPTTAAPATSSLATTGPGPHLWLVAIVGFVVLYLGSVVLALVERPRSLLRRALRLAPHSPAMATPLPVEMATVSPVADRGVWLSEPAMVQPMAKPVVQPIVPPIVQPIVKPSVKPAYPKAGGSSGLWFDGWEPQDRTRD